MRAPDHQRVADELLRVRQPGRTIAMINFAADGLLAGFLDVLFAGYASAAAFLGVTAAIVG